MTPHEQPLIRLARLYGIQTEYHDAFGKHRAATEESLLELLKALGAPVSGHADVESATREREQSVYRRFVPAASVAWEGQPVSLDIRIEAEHEATSLRVSLEDGDPQTFDLDLAQGVVLGSFESEGRRFVHKRVAFRAELPVGYHRARVTGAGHEGETRLLAAPVEFYVSPRSWGLFCPLYALSSDHSVGAGDFSDLRAFSTWVQELGGSVVGTLPLMAAFLDKWFEPSPYRPVSRLHFNEAYLDVYALPDLAVHPDIARGLESESAEREIEELRCSPEVDLRRVAALKRPVLQALADRYFHDRPIHEWASTDERRSIADYAHFRAALESTGRNFREWTWDMQQGRLPPDLIHSPEYRYHAYVQEQAREQLAAVASAGGSRSPLYLDLPLGVHPDGYDAWKYRRCFVEGAEAGAPPDGFFAKGQKWGFAPLDPIALAETGYEYFAQCLRAQMGVAGMLRIDHVMGLHRLFCVPAGREATEGAYLGYPADELYAVLSIESRRHRCMVVGEDLGTVSDEVRHAMARHRAQRMYVFQFEVDGAIERGIAVGDQFVASANTHDVPPFAAYYRGDDIALRVELGHLTKEEAAAEEASRDGVRHALRRCLLGDGGEGDLDLERILDAVLLGMARSDARSLLINLEDLWLETEAQNVPGTTERPNWRRKARFSLGQIRRMKDIDDLLRRVDRARRERGE